MSTPCSVALLESALAGNLPPADEAALHRHLEECEACSTALEQMAGGPDWCQEAVSLLVRQKLDAGVPSREPWSEIDFTVEHLEPADEPNVLGRLGGYDVLDIIGRGGMGVVLKGFDRELKRSVAIKVLAPHLAQNSLARKRFAREAQAAAAVVHPHVVAIHQVQPGGRLPFLVMPLVAGESLAERLNAQGTLELKEILRIGIQAAAGLAAAHEQGLVHRDVKPANILLEKGVERAVLTDFGLACAADDVTLTRWGIIAGTPPYMSPEQARGEPLDGRSDLFSLGCVLYEMATGVSPFLADSVVATIRRLVDDPPQAMASLNPELPPWFIVLVERLLEKDPAKRFNSAKDVSELLEGCLAHVQQPASVPLPAGLPKSASRLGWRSNLGIKGVLTMIGTLGIGLLGVLLVTANPPDIAGEWTGEDWGTVVLEKISDTEYRGRYIDGEIQLKWSRIERRFNGTWSEGKLHAYTPDGKGWVSSADRFGDLSVRLVGDEIRGALTTDANSKINPATPRLADLTLRRVVLSKYPTNRLRLSGTVETAVPGLPYPLDNIRGTVNVRIGSSNDTADRFLSVVGTMQPPAQVSHIWAENTGTVAELLVELGQRIETGQPIVQLNCPPLQDQVQANQRLVDQLNALLASIKLSPREAPKESIDIAKAEFDKAHALAEHARGEEARAVTLAQARTGAITQTEVDTARATLAAREADEKIAKVRLDALVEQPSRYQKELEETEKQLQAAKAQLAESLAMLEPCTVRAPADGIVLSLRAVVGQLIRAHTTPGASEICQIADMDGLVIYVDVQPDVASRIDFTRDVKVTDLRGRPVGTGEILRAVPSIDGPQTLQNPVQVLVANPNWQLYKPGGQVVVNFKLRAVTPGATGSGSDGGGGAGVNSGGLPATNNGFVVTDLNTGNTAIIDQPVTVTVAPKPGDSPAAILEAAFAQLQQAEIKVQLAKDHAQEIAAEQAKVEKTAMYLESERKACEKLYKEALERQKQKPSEGGLVDEYRNQLEQARAREADARAQAKSWQVQSAVAAELLRQAEAELEAAQEKARAANTPHASAASAAPPGATLLEVLFSSPASSLENLHRILATQGALTDSRREKAQELLDRLLALFVEEEQLRKRFHSDHPKVEELRARIVSVVKEALDLSGVDTSRLAEFADFQAAAEATRLGKEERARLAVAPAPRDLTGFRQNVGQSYLFLVTGPSEKEINTAGNAIWGSDVYTDDSPLAVAAVHAGLLKPGEAAVLRITTLPGQESYQGETRHGVYSSSWGAWSGSYRIEKPTAEDSQHAPRRLQHAYLRVQELKANFQAAAALVQRAEANLQRCEAQQKRLEKEYQRMVVLHKQQAINESLVDETLLRCQAAEAETEVARADLKGAQAKSAAAATQFSLAEAGLQAVQAEAVWRGVLPIDFHEPLDRDGPAPPPFAVAPAPRDLTGFRQNVGQSYLFLVTGPPEKELNQANNVVWGSDVYTDDSPLALAAVHAGLLKPGMQAVLRVTILPGQESYQGRMRNGVDSVALVGTWRGSYRIEKPTAEDFRRINAAEQPQPARATVSQQSTKDENAAIRGEILPPPVSPPSSHRPAPDKHALAIAEAELDKARAAVELARANAARIAELAKVRVVDKGLFDEADARVRMAEADEKVAQARLDTVLSADSDKLALVIARAELVKAQAVARLVRIKAIRFKELYKVNAVAQETVINAETDVRNAEAEEKVAQARLDYLLERSSREKEEAKYRDLDPNSPAPAGAGTGSSTNPSPVTPSQPVRHTVSQQPTKREVVPFELFTGRVEQVDPAEKSIAFRFDIDERSYRRYRELLRAGKIKDTDNLLAARVADEEDFPHASRIVQIDDKFDPKTGTVGVYGVFADPDGLLLPGMLVSVRMTLGPPRTVLEVPVGAVHWKPSEAYEPNQAQVWVVNDQSTVQRRLVRTGGKDESGRMWIIEEGLSPQDMVVVEGTAGLQPGDNIGPAPTEQHSATAPAETSVQGKRDHTQANEDHITITVSADKDVKYQRILELIDPRRLPARRADGLKPGESIEAPPAPGESLPVEAK